MFRSFCRREWLGICVALTLVLSSSVGAATIPLVDPNSGLDSGWQASFADGLQVSLIVDAVTSDAVFIQKFVDFEHPVGPGGVFPAVNIDFTQTLPDALTVPSIVIVDEGLTNLTGSPWGGFDFLIADKGDAWFNVPLSSDFDTSPFVNQTYGNFIGGDPDRATLLHTTGGTVPHLGTFFPGSGSGELWIDVDLAAADITSFNLKERPIPEPGTLALLGVGAILWARRRRSC